MTPIYEVMRTVGHIARLAYPNRDIPESVLSLLLIHPGKALPKIIKPPQPMAIRRLVDTLPEDMPKNVGIEDQGGFWLTWHGQAGGSRPGSGRPVEVEGARRVNVMLDDATIERAKTLGAGNLSAGLRAAVSRVSDD